jgi:hypothetical protein
MMVLVKGNEMKFFQYNCEPAKSAKRAAASKPTFLANALLTVK